MAKLMNNHFRRYRLSPLFFVAPYFIVYAAFFLGSTFFSFYLSLTNWDGIHPPRFQGIKNYIRMIVLDDSFILSLQNTFLIVALSVLFTISFALILGYIYEFRLRKRRRVFQVLNLLPYITAPIAVGIIFSILFDRNAGIVNDLLKSLHVIRESIYWLGTPMLSRVVLILLNTWTFSGYTSVFLLAGLSSVPEEVMESARIDGAGNVSIYVRICIPLIKPVMTFVVVNAIIGGLQLFEQPLMLFGSVFSGVAGSTHFPMGGPDKAVLTMMLNFYDYTFANLQFGYGAALAYSMSVVIGVTSIISLRLLWRWEER